VIAAVVTIHWNASMFSPALARVSEQSLNGTSAHIRLFSAMHSFTAIHGMVDLRKSWI